MSILDDLDAILDDMARTRSRIESARARVAEALAITEAKTGGPRLVKSDNIRRILPEGVTPFPGTPGGAA